MLVIQLFSQPFWYRLGLTLTHFLWQGLAVAILIGTAVRLLRLRRGNTRYVTYLIAFIVVAACPVVTFMAVETPAKPITRPPVTEMKTPAPSGAIPYPLVPANEVSRQAASRAASADLIPLRERIHNYLQISLPWALACWVIGVLVLSVRLLLGFIGVYRWRRRLDPLPQVLRQRVGSLSERLGMPDFSRVFISPSALQAIAVGYLRPMVLLPAAMVAQMQPEMLEAVIAHELAHIRRFDLWVNLAQRVAETLLFYHPAVWWLSNRLRSERELCCDELAVKATGERLTNSRFWLAGLVTVLFLAALAAPTIFVLTARAETKAVAPPEDKSAKSLHQAAADGDIEQVKLNLSQGSHINAKDNKGRTALHRAASEGHADVVKLLIQLGADVKARDRSQRTPLHNAATKDKKSIELLLSGGADVNAKNKWGNTPLRVAMMSTWAGRNEVVELLLAKGAKVSALHLAAYMGDIEKLKKCLEDGIDINSQGDAGSTALHLTANSGNKDVVEFLISKGATIDARDAYYWTPLLYAACHNHKDIMDLLLAKGADVNAKDDRGFTLLTAAIWNPDENAIKVLIGKGANVNVKDTMGLTPLVWAIWMQRSRRQH